MTASSFEAQVISRPERPVEAMAETRSRNVNDSNLNVGNGPLTSQRRDTVHEDPKSRQCLWRLKHTVESQDQRKHERSNVSCCLSIRKCSDQHMSKRAGEYEKLYEEQENQSLALRGGNSATGVDRVVVGSEHHDTEYDLVGDFDDDVRYEEGLPAVCF